MKFDLRLPVGLMFLLFSLILIGLGCFGSPELRHFSPGLNLNLDWGLVLLAFGAGMLALAWRGKSRLIVAVALALGACAVVSAPAQAPATAPQRVACVGDSITWGVGASNPFHSYPTVLGRMLGKGWDVQNFGNSGKTLLNAGDAPYAKTDSMTKALASQPNVVVVMLGTNDTKDPNWKFKDQFVDDYKALLAPFQALPTHPKIFLVRPPYVAGTGNYAINEPNLLEELPMIDAVAQQTGLPEIDVHGATDKKDELFRDRVHPNDDGHLVLARAVYQAITGKEFAGDLPAFSEGTWSGYEMRQFEVDGRLCTLVVPPAPLPGNPWVWRTEFFGQYANDDAALAGKGYYIAYMDVSNMYGAPVALDHMDKFYDYLLATYQLNPKAVMEGLSRGGLFAFNWTARHPDRVAMVYGDAPVCDFKSWPGAKGKSAGSPGDWKRLISVYGFASEDEALAYKGNPVDNLAPLAAAKVPILGVYGDADKTVPPDENILIVASRYQALGGEIKLIPKPGVDHHPHGLPDPTPIVEFIQAHTPPPAPAAAAFASPAPAPAS